MGGGQNYGPFLGTLNTRCRIIQKGTIILTTTQKGIMENGNYCHGLYRVYIGILEKDMEAIIMGYTDYGLNLEGGGPTGDYMGYWGTYSGMY